MIIANIFQPLIDLFEAVLIFIHGIVGSWGFAIIALTVVIRALLLPLAVKQMRSMLVMQAHAPELKKIQQRYKDDPQRRNQETMRFYSENKVNPFASCLPMVAQLPVFLSLFYMLRSDLRRDICPAINPPGVAETQSCGSDVAAAHFLFIPDITDKATGAVLITLIGLYVGSQLLSSILMMTPNVERNQRLLMLGLPVIFVPFIISFPAGLLVYWITTNLWTIGQQQVLKRVLGKHEPPPPEQLAAEKQGGGLFGKFADMASQQQGAAAVGKGSSSRNGKSRGAKEEAAARVTKAPPPPPRQKKRKRSGRRR